MVYPDTINHVFDYLMPNPVVTVNEHTGLVKRVYTNSIGNRYNFYYQLDQVGFWEAFKGKPADIGKRDFSKATDQEIKAAVKVANLFANRGTLVTALHMDSDDPEGDARYFKAHGNFVEGENDTTIKFDPDAPLEFKFHKAGSKRMIANKEAKVSTIDHTVINGYKRHLSQITTMFSNEFWGGDARDLRANGVQFYTRVLTSDLESTPQLVPFNNLYELEEALLE